MQCCEAADNYLAPLLDEKNIADCPGGLFKGLGGVEEHSRIAQFAGLGLFNGKGWEEEMIKIHISE